MPKKVIFVRLKIMIHWDKIKSATIKEAGIVKPIHAIIVFLTREGFTRYVTSGNTITSG
jgi:hypothetical protein